MRPTLTAIGSRRQSKTDRSSQIEGGLEYGITTFGGITLAFEESWLSPDACLPSALYSCFVEKKIKIHISHSIGGRKEHIPRLCSYRAITA